jgi:hypothetical protein
MVAHDLSIRPDNTTPTDPLPLILYIFYLSVRQEESPSLQKTRGE